MPTMLVGPAVPAIPLSDEALVAAVVQVADQRGVDAAVRELGRAADYAQRVNVVDGIIGTLVARDVRVAAAFAAALPEGQAQIAAIDLVAPAFVRADANDAVRWAHDLDGPVARLARRAVGDALVATESERAIARVQALPSDPARGDLLLATAAAWARRDPRAAVSWVENLPRNDEQQRLTAAIAFELAQKTPREAIDVASSLPPGRNRWLLFSAIAQTWVAVDRKAAVAWASQLPAGEPRDAALAGVETGLGVPIMRRRSNAPGLRGIGARGFGGTAASPAPMWPELTSPAFAAWLATQYPGLTREEAILEYVRQRTVLQPAVVGQWLAGLAPSVTRDRAMELYVDGLLPTSPREAAQWLQSLPRSDRSDAMIERTARDWLRTNPDAAEAWLRDMPLPPERKEQLLREAGRH